MGLVKTLKRTYSFNKHFNSSSPSSIFFSFDNSLYDWLEYMKRSLFRWWWWWWWRRQATAAFYTLSLSLYIYSKYINIYKKFNMRILTYLISIFVNKGPIIFQEKIRLIFFPPRNDQNFFYWLSKNWVFYLRIMSLFQLFKNNDGF